MTSTDIMIQPDRLLRTQALYPGAIGIGKITGFYHQARGEIRRMEKRGEVIAVRRFARLDELSGIVEIPYVRMKERGQVRREQGIRVGVFAGSALIFLTAVAWLTWESRYVIMFAAGMAAILALLIRILPHLIRGCPGIHCAGCGG